MILSKKGTTCTHRNNYVQSLKSSLIQVMMKEYYKIKDRCREGLMKYMAEALVYLPEIRNPKVLDIGCGTGVPTICFAENYGGMITAIDNDINAIEWLKEKIKYKGLENQPTAINASFYDMKSEPHFLDIVIAEGFLNVIGFEQGFLKMITTLKKGGYFVIHDEYKDHEKKCDLIRKNHCEIAGTVFLDESAWWNDYYKKLETEIQSDNTVKNIDLWKSDLKEIELCRKDPASFRSMYYIAGYHGI